MPLPPECRGEGNNAVRLADKNIALLQQNPHHHSLRRKEVGACWTARVGYPCRVLARLRAEGFVWFWIGHQGEYDRPIEG